MFLWVGVIKVLIVSSKGQRQGRWPHNMSAMGQHIVQTYFPSKNRKLQRFLINNIINSGHPCIKLRHKSLLLEKRVLRKCYQQQNANHWNHYVQISTCLENLDTLSMWYDDIPIYFKNWTQLQDEKWKAKVRNGNSRCCECCGIIYKLQQLTR